MTWDLYNFELFEEKMKCLWKLSQNKRDAFTWHRTYETHCSTLIRRAITFPYKLALVLTDCRARRSRSKVATRKETVWAKNRKWVSWSDWLAASHSPPPPMCRPTTRAPPPWPALSALTHPTFEARMFSGSYSTWMQKLACQRTAWFTEGKKRKF